MSKEPRLAQDRPQHMQGREEQRYEERTIQDTPQYEETLRGGMTREEREAEERRLAEEEKRREAEKRERERKQKVKDVLSQIKPVPPSLQRSRVTQAQFDAHERVREQIRSRNLRLYASIGIRPNTVQTTSRTASDILSGKSNAPLRQASSSVQRQVQIGKFNRSLGQGNIIFTPQSAQQELSRIEQNFQDRQAEERERRRQHSIKVAQGKAAQGVQQNFTPGSVFSVESGRRNVITNAPVNTRVISTSVGSGTLADPIRSTQPVVGMVSPILIQTMNENRSVHSQSISGVIQNNSVQRPIEQYVVTTTDGKQRTFNSLENAEKFAERVNRGTQVPIPQNVPTPNKNDFTNFLQAKPAAKILSSSGNPFTESLLQFINRKGKALSELQKETAKEKPNSIETFGLSAMVSLQAQGASLMNLVSGAGDFIDEKITGRPAPVNRKDLFVPQTLDSVLIGGTVEDGFDQKGTGIARAQELFAKQSAAENAGQIAGLAIPFVATGGATAVGKAAGIGGKTITMPTAAKTAAGLAVKEPVKVATEFQVLGKTVITKTLKDPATITIKNPIIGKPQIKPVSNKGTFSKGAASPKTVLERTELEPHGRGLEIMTGAKEQTRFNVGLVDELVKQGKATPESSRFTELVTEGVKLSRKAPSVVHSGSGPKPLQNVEAGIQTETMFRSIRELQSPLNWFRGQRRVGQIGGSFSQNIQLRSQFQKKAIHDIDIDVRSEKIAQRAAKKIAEEMKKVESETTKFTLSPGRGTKVISHVKGQKSDETFEALSPKDINQYGGEAAETGLRFGEKYRVDKLSQYLKRPIKDPDTGNKARDIKDQVLAKGASNLSIQGKTTERFVGTPDDNLAGFVKRKTALQDAGKFDVGPAILRGKDIVDQYNIFKSKALDLKDAGKIREGKRLDDVAEEIKDLNPDIDFTAKTKGLSTDAPLESPSLASMLSKQSKRTQAPIASTVPVALNASPRKVEAREQIQPRSINSMMSQRKLPSARSVTSARSPSIRTTSPSSIKSPSVKITSSPKSITTTASKKPASSKLTKSKTGKSPSSTILSTGSPSTVSPSTKTGTSRSVPVITPPINTNPPSLQTGKKKAGFFEIPPILNTTKKAPGKVSKRKDFLGNTRLDNFVGLINRKEIIEGDKRTNRQVKLDKKKRVKKVDVLGKSKPKKSFRF